MEKNKPVVFSASSKTFMLGEYLILEGGPAIVLNTQPVFQLWVFDNEIQTIVDGIHPESPAGKLLTENDVKIKNKKIVFADPHSGKGGFGASSAQYALCDQFINDKETDFSILERYHVHSWNGEGRKPSGADVISQSMGNSISLVDLNKNEIQSAAWPFTDIDFLLFHTGQKLPTHEHLKELDLSNTDKMKDIVLSAWKNLSNTNSEGFIQSITDFADELKARNWVASHTASHLQKMSSWNEVLAAKGCGALGSDTILVLCKNGEQKKVLSKAQDLGLEFIANSDHLSTTATKHVIESEVQI